MFLVRIFNVDFYMAAPIEGLDPLYSDFRGSSINNVPVIRIFGASEAGYKTCLHIHSVFPYLYIPHDGTEEVGSFMYQIAKELDHAINVSFGHTESTAQHVYKIVLVSGIPFYGYHPREHQFLKIFFYNPLIMKRACALLQNGNIFGRIYQLHESHIPFILQFMIDYNLHGMSFISLSQVFYRVNNDVSQDDIPSQFLLPPTVPKRTICYLEVDGLAEYIVNKIEVAMGKITKNPGIANLWADEEQRRRNKDENSQISPCMTQNRVNVPPTESHILYRNMLKDKVILEITEKYKVDNSLVYPAETPKLHSLISASFVQSHNLSNSYSSSLKNSMDSSYSFSENSVLENSCYDDTQAMDLLHVLQKLAENANENIQEDDSILSQTIVVQDESEDDIEIEMSMPFVTTPTKTIFESDYIQESIKVKEEPFDINKSVDDNLSNANNLEDLYLTDFSIARTKKDIKSSVENDGAVCVESYALNNHKGLTILEQVKRKLSFQEIEQHELRKDEDVKPINDKIKCDNEKQLHSNLSKAEEYDRTAKYICIEGSSKQQKICDDSSDSSLFKLSSDSYSSTLSKVSTQSLGKNSYNNENHFSILNQMECGSKLTEEQNIFSDSEPLISSSDVNSSISQMSQPFNSSINNNDRTIGNKLVYEEKKMFVPRVETSTNLILFDKEEQQSIPKQNFSQHCSMLHPTVLKDNEISLGKFQYYVLMPKFNPPSRESIIHTLEEYDIPLITYQKPFCSNYEDVSAEVQIGHKRLKVGTLYSDLIEFESSSIDVTLQKLIMDRVQQLFPNEQISNKLFRKKLTFCEDTFCILTPSRLPPSQQEVLSWIKIQKSKTNTADVKKEKKTILIPFSPNELHSDESLITISPVSPISEKLNENEKLNETPVRPNKSKIRKKRRSKLCSKSIMKTKNFLEVVPHSLLKKTLINSQSINNFINLSQTPDSSHITGVSPDNTNCFMVSLENLQKARAVTEYQYLTMLVMELHIKTRLDLKPNPEFDPIRAIFYSILNDAPGDCNKNSYAFGAIVVLLGDTVNFKNSLLCCTSNCNITFVDSEIDMINEFLQLIRKYDPDIIAGYEIELLSWKYLIERGQILKINIQLLLSRAEVKNVFEDDINSDLKVPGRIVLDVWRLMRHEIALQSYTFENVIYHILHKRVPFYSFKHLSFWWEYNSPVHRHKTFNFYFYRVKGILELFDNLDLIGRTSELARLFGIQFYEVLSRGSQFRVESMMLRLAKPMNYIAVSPSVQQKVKMKAPEFLPLILEPDSQFYIDPVIVLDFQSLYPSMMIAYNFCFSTCLGRVEYLNQNSPFQFGATQLKVHPKLIAKLLQKDLLTFSPCGVAFVKPKVREGVLPRMLSEILDTRLMVKKSMKQNVDDKVLQRVLHSRQLGLKLIANVTYGYCAANYSGRMPSVEVADSVVSKGRETLMRAIKLIENTPQWGAKVVYGDTDSIFVLLRGQSKENAFKIGQEIADQVTNDNPSPVKLKLEKCFLPCILQTKKRYVGYMFESPTQMEPEFCAKGIETVRRDGCPAVSKMLEKCLKILFDTRDVSLVRKYVVRQFSKLLSGRVSLQDLTFAKEYRGAGNYRPSACVPVLELTRKWLSVDKRSEPRSGQRVAYVIVNGPPGLPLIKLVRSPYELLTDLNLLPNIPYYITKVIIPPINRCFMLIGVDLNKWYNSMPRKQIQISRISPSSKGKKTAISHYFVSTDCIICNQQTQDGVCVDCRKSPQEAVATLSTKIRIWNRSHQQANLGSILHHIEMSKEGKYTEEDQNESIKNDEQVVNFNINTEKYPRPLSKTEVSRRLSFSTSDPATKRVIAPYVRNVRKSRLQKIEKHEQSRQFRFYLQQKPSILVQNLSTLLSDVDLCDIIKDNADVLKSVCKAKGVNLYTVDAIAGVIYHSIKNDYCRANWKIEPGHTVAAYVAYQKEYVMVDDVLGDLRFPEGVGYKDETIKSVLCVPVVSPEDNCFAIIELYRDTSQPVFGRDELKLVVIITGWMGVAIHQNEQRVELQKQRELHEYMISLLKCYFAGEAVFNQIITEIVDFAKTSIGAERGAFYAIVEGSEDLAAKAYEYGIYPTELTTILKKNLTVQFDKHGGIPGLVVRTGELVNIEDTYNDPRYTKDADDKNQFITRSILCVPIMGVNDILGAIKLINKISGIKFTNMDEVIINTIANYAGIIIQFDRLQDKIFKLEKRNECSMDILRYHIRPCLHDIAYFESRAELDMTPENFEEFHWYIPVEYTTMMPHLVLYMFNKIIGTENLNTKEVMEFILSVRKSYRDNFYHHWGHGFCVCHCMYNIIKRNMEVFNETERKALIIGTLCHDIDHRGFGNNFLHLVEHPWTFMYEESVLENHHYFVTMILLQEYNIFNSISSEEFEILSKELKKLILSTDLVQYFKFRTRLTQIYYEDEFDWSNPLHRDLIKAIMMTTCDLCGMCKPYNISKKMTENLYREFYIQGDIEKTYGLCPLSMMDRERSNEIPEDQAQFITVVLMPCVELLETLLPNTADLTEGARKVREAWWQLIELQGQRVWRQEESIVIDEE
ncbi:hypothetical protein FQA39_LY00671 [Lamprigera yunnana]|nr:hypothetical protein FQA39_LY00671 [Lamprigera yunnana]